QKASVLCTQPSRSPDSVHDGGDATSESASGMGKPLSHTGHHAPARAGMLGEMVKRDEIHIPTRQTCSLWPNTRALAQPSSKLTILGKKGSLRQSERAVPGTKTGKRRSRRRPGPSDGRATVALKRPSGK